MLSTQESVIHFSRGFLTIIHAQDPGMGPEGAIWGGRFRMSQPLRGRAGVLGGAMEQ